MYKFFLSLVFCFTLSALLAQNDIVYGINTKGTIYKFSNVNPSTGEGFSSFSSFSGYGSAALGINKEGSWLYYIPYGEFGEGKGEGKLWIRSINVITGSTSDKIAISEFDMNGQANNDLGFVRMGIDGNNVGWIVAKENSSGTIYLAKFNADEQGNGTNPVLVGTMTTSDNDDASFANGDIAFDNKGNMYALSNSSGEATKIYTVSKANLDAASGSTTLQFKYNVVDHDGNGFEKNVNGIAFSSTGSLYVSAADGIFFIDANTLNQNTQGQIRIIKRGDNDKGIADLATQYHSATALPVSYGYIYAENINGQLEVYWQSLQEKQTQSYTIEASKDGNNWIALGTVTSQARDGNSSEILNYSFSTGSLPISLAGVSIAFLLGAVFKSRRLRLVMTIIGIGFLISCSKNISEKTAIHKNADLFIRIANKDINQKINYSKVIKVQNL